MNLEIFKKDNFEIRVVVDENNEPLFCLKDVCKALEIADSKQVRAALDTEFEKEGVFFTTPFETKGGIQNFTMITEPELYYILLRSNKPNAKSFRLWVNKEVLPAIRKHGGYLTPQKIEEVLLNPDTIIKLATELKTERTKREALELEAKANKPYVSFAKSVEASVDSALIGDYAKCLAAEGVKVGGRRLFSWLRDSSYINADNKPYQEYIDRGYFELIPYTYATATGTHTKYTTKITGKGQIALAGKITKYFTKGEN